VRTVMNSSTLDDIDKRIIYLLQENSRRSITDIAQRVNVADNTVRNRLERLESAGVIRGYTVDLDYSTAEVQHHYLFICTIRVTERETITGDLLEIPGVTEVRTLMTGQRNVHVVAAGDDNDDITRIALAIDELGLRIDVEDLIRTERRRPFETFATEIADQLD
jgi:DNA-binding Lrp family transcriptional regulator